MTKWVQGRVVRQQRWRDGLYSLIIEAPISPFIAGQFTQLAFPLIEDKVIFRPYSFANGPEEPLLEFYYNVVPSGDFSPKLGALKAGDTVLVSKRANGFFTLKEVPSAVDLWLFASGTGFGVFLSLLKTKEPWQRFERIMLVHSVRHADSLTHQYLIAAWQEAYPTRFHWLPVVTGEYCPQTLSERIPQLLATGQLETATDSVICPENSQTMLCGNPKMIEEVSAWLTTRGLTRNRPRAPGQITTENYWK